MALLREAEQAKVRERLQEMTEPVKLVYFTQELECQFCRETGQLLDEVSSLSDKLTLEVFNFQIDKEKAARYGVDKIPATVVEGKKDLGIKLYGIPMGYEFASLMEAILGASRGDSNLSPQTREQLKAVRQPMHIEVFVTPT